ncbi:MAG TPA: response regulator [Anaerolineae bacterium]|nr:response regulator [Anaerolineae bacterium]HQK12367.1 response regulator [Anaerolineae bacterium]
MAKILVAEDERDIRELIAFTLRFAGFDVELATNGLEAVEKAQQIIPDLILMDVRMPRMTGYQACGVLKENHSTQDIPVIFLSAKGQESEIQEGLEAGAMEYILKPFAPDELTAQVNRILKELGKA